MNAHGDEACASRLPVLARPAVALAATLFLSAMLNLHLHSRRVEEGTKAEQLKEELRLVTADLRQAEREIDSRRRGMDVHAKSGVPIRWCVLYNGLTDSELVIDGVAVTVLLRDAVPRRFERIHRVLDSYPADALWDWVSEIVVARDVKYDGVRVGGLTHNGRIFLADRGLGRLALSWFYFESKLHSEMSSAILRANREHFPLEAWRAATVRGLREPPGGMSAVRTGEDSLDWDHGLAERGFICEYAVSSEENDFNCLATALIVSWDRFWEFSEAHDLIRRKAELVISYYRSVHPSLDRDWFARQQLRSLSRQHR